MTSDFDPPWWLRNRHLQTVWGRFTRSRRRVAFRREIIETPDGDELVLDHMDAQPEEDRAGAERSAPAARGRVAGQAGVQAGDHARPSTSRAHFILLHGLEGSSYSVYMQGMLAAIARHGCSATALNFRSCARDPHSIFRDLPNKRPRFYHSGETTDFDHVVRMLAARISAAPIVAIGASLGGNVVLKWLGENPGQTFVTAAATISVPYDLGAGAAFLETFAGRVYVGSFLRSLKKKIRETIRRFPETGQIIDVPCVLASRSFRDFDESATGPLHGFSGADDYYDRASSIKVLGRIRTPTLCISAEDDPFLPPEALQRAQKAASPYLEFRITARGGHVGFVTGRTPWDCTYWAEDLAVNWLMSQLARVPQPRPDAGQARSIPDFSSTL